LPLAFDCLSGTYTKPGKLFPVFVVATSNLNNKHMKSKLIVAGLAILVAACNSKTKVESGTYVDLNTGDSIIVEADSVTGYAINAETRKPVYLYVNHDKDTIFTTGQKVNGMVIPTSDGKYEVDGAKVKVDDEDVKIKYADYKKTYDSDSYTIEDGDYKEKGDDGDVKVKDGDYKKKVEADGDSKTKDDDYKKKVSEDGDVKIKTEDTKTKVEDGEVVTKKRNKIL
jgi:hypothetical protein